MVFVPVAGVSTNLINTSSGSTTLTSALTLCSRFQGLHFFQAPLIRDPPSTPLPDPAEDPSWYGEIWAKYPTSETLIPASHGYVFRAITGLRQIANDMACIMFEGTTAIRSLTSCEIVGFHCKLDEWYSQLPEALTPKRTVLPCQLKMQ